LNERIILKFATHSLSGRQRIGWYRDAFNKSLNDLGALFKTGTSVEHVENITGEAGEIKTSLLTLFDSGTGSSGWDAANKMEGSGSNAAGSVDALWPGHQWRTIEEVHNLRFGLKQRL
jgi:hypothetical protein